MFKRRTPRTWSRAIRETIYPPGGWKRAAGYVLMRLKRLPDTPQRIARGVAAGVFLAFSPLYGLHFIVTFLAAFVIRANVLAAVLASLIGNPLTWPLIITASLATGENMLHRNSGVPRTSVIHEFGTALHQIFANLMAMFTPAVAHWDRLAAFWHDIFLPFLVGGSILGFIFGGIAYFATVRALRAYQDHRRHQLKTHVQPH
ncbi:MAG: DUF2062 domain-containing protein [Deltaproteobacteria bacterium]